MCLQSTGALSGCWLGHAATADSSACRKPVILQLASLGTRSHGAWAGVQDSKQKPQTLLRFKLGTGTLSLLQPSIDQKQIAKPSFKGRGLRPDGMSHTVSLPGSADPGKGDCGATFPNHLLGSDPGFPMPKLFHWNKYWERVLVVCGESSW